MEEGKLLILKLLFAAPKESTASVRLYFMESKLFPTDFTVAAAPICCAMWQFNVSPPRTPLLMKNKLSACENGLCCDSHAGHVAYASAAYPHAAPLCSFGWR